MKKVIIGLALISSVSVFADADINSRCERFLSEAIDKSLICGLQKNRVKNGQSPDAFFGLNECIKTEKSICEKSSHPEDMDIFQKPLRALQVAGPNVGGFYICNIQRNIIINADTGEARSRGFDASEECHSELYSMYEQFMN